MRLRRWLLDVALPLWWERGADREGGGYFSLLSIESAIPEGRKRLRVHARNAHVYALGAALGWTGPAAAACRHGLQEMIGAKGADGLYRPAPGVDSDLNGMGLLYDQAFVLLALASDRAAFGGDAQETAALALVETLRAFAHPRGGFAESPGLAAPLFSNPNMHLFEAFQAWMRVSADFTWRALAADEARLVLDRLIDPTTGVLCERFGPEWSAEPAAERRVWPGHLYEWAFLLFDWPDADALSEAAAMRLVRAAEASGVDAQGVTLFALDGALTPVDRGARLWSQTERIRACARAASRSGDAALWRATADACATLERFLDVPIPGLWRDRLEADGAFRREPAPASSLYHIAGAIAELDRQVGPVA